MDKTLFLLVCLYMVYRIAGHEMDVSCVVTVYQQRLVEKMNSVEENVEQITRSFEHMSAQVKDDLVTTKTNLEAIREHSAELNTSTHVESKNIREEAGKYLQKRTEEFETIKKQLEDQLEAMETEFREIRQELKNISAYLTKKLSHGNRFVYADILQMETSLESFLQEQMLKAMEKTYSETFPEFGEFVRGQKAEVREPAYAFSATTVKSHHLQRQEPIIFTDVILNDADVFDVNSGVFMSPTNGTFKFSLTLCIAYGKAMSFQVVVNDKVVSRVAGAAHNNAVESVTGKAVVALMEGDKVWVEAYNNGYYTLSTNGFDSLNKFSGYLLH